MPKIAVVTKQWRRISRSIFHAAKRIAGWLAALLSRREARVATGVSGIALVVLVLARWFVTGEWNSLQAIWCCVTIGVSLAVVLAQLPRPEIASIEVSSLGSIGFWLPPPPSDGRITCRVEADLALIPVRESCAEGQPLLKACIPAVSLDRQNDCRIAIGEREWLSEGGVTRPFRIHAQSTKRGMETAITMQLASANGALNGARQLTWTQSDADGPMTTIIPHQELGVSGAGKLEVLVTRGPIAVLRTRTIGTGFAISHDGKRYVRVDTPLGKTLYAPPNWPEDRTESCLGSTAPEGLRVWREFGGDGPTWQAEYKRRVQFGWNLIDRPTLVILGDGCVVRAEGVALYEMDKPFVLVLTKYTHDPCFCTEGAPYMTLVGAVRPPGEQPWLLGVEKWQYSRPCPVRLTLMHSRGRVRMERLGEELEFRDYDTVSANAQSAYLIVRPTDPQTYYLRASCDDLTVNSRRLVRSYWATSAEWAHWVCYGILTLLWVPILQWVARVVWGP